jgi:clan AA aspartic protease
MRIPTVKRSSDRLPPCDVDPTTGGNEMGLVYAELELISAEDLALFRRGFLVQDDVKSMQVSALVDTGAYQLVINEQVKQRLGLFVIETRVVTMADETERTVEIVGPIEIRFKNRRTVADAVVLPSAKDVLLGSIPMEDLDVIIDPKRRTLEVNPAHPNIAATIVKQVANELWQQQ